MNSTYSTLRMNSVKQFDNIAHMYYLDIHKYCLSRFKNGMDPSIAEDCTQKTFIVLLEQLRKGVQIDYPRAFLYRTAENFVKRAITQHFKQCKTHQLLEDIDRLNVTNADNDLCFCKLFESDIYIEQDTLISEVLNRLTDSDRAIYTMRYRKKCTISELAMELGISYSAVTSRIYRLRLKIENIVHEEIRKINNVDVKVSE